MAGDRLRVLFLDHTAQLSGAEISLSRVLPELEGIEQLVLLGSDGPLADRLRNDGIDVEISPLPLAASRFTRGQRLVTTRSTAATWVTVRYALATRSVIKRGGVDLVYANSMKAAIYGGLAARLARRPAIWHLRDRIEIDSLPRSSVVALRVWARLGFTRIIANSSCTAASLGWLRRPPLVIPSPVDEALFALPDRPSGHGLRVVMVGRLSPWKGQDVFIRAMAATRTARMDARIVGSALFGEDRYVDSLNEQVRQLGLESTIELTGFRENIALELADADIVVHASTTPEPFGLVVAEAMAAGRAIVAARAGGPAEMIRDGVHGLLATPGDASEIAEHVDRLAADAPLRGRFGQAARARARRYSPGAIAPRVAEACRQTARACRGDATPRRVVINGRFLKAHVSGVQRYAEEVIAALASDGTGQAWEVIIPPARLTYGTPARSAGSRWSGWPGHVWEQSALPVLARLGGPNLLVNLCNWAPLLAGRQVVALHDAATFLVPQFFGRAYVQWQRAAARSLGRNASAMLTLSERTKGELVEHAGIDPARAFVVPPGVSEVFTTVERPTSTGPPYCLLVGAHDPRKNAEFILSLWPEVQQELGVELRLVTHPFSRPHQGLLRLSGDVTVYSALSDRALARLYAGALCVLWPSHYEGFGLPLLEGIATGTPFLSTAVGAAEELAVRPEQILPLERGSWIEGIRWILDREDSLTADCRLRASNYSWHATATLVKSVIEVALESEGH